jgi:hypothetical protein
MNKRYLVFRNNLLHNKGSTIHNSYVRFLRKILLSKKEGFKGNLGFLYGFPLLKDLLGSQLG